MTRQNQDNSMDALESLLSEALSPEIPSDDLAARIIASTSPTQQSDQPNLRLVGQQQVSESIDRLRRYYLEEGFPHVKIDSRVTKFDTSFIHRVYLEVDEGPRVSIERFKIEGRISRPKMYYIKFIEDHSSEILGRGYYNRDSLDKGLDNLVVHLKNQGFLKAKIQSLRVEFSEDKESMRSLNKSRQM
mgnify:CR=1 FL=1